MSNICTNAFVIGLNYVAKVTVLHRLNKAWLVCVLNIINFQAT